MSVIAKIVVFSVVAWFAIEAIGLPWLIGGGIFLALVSVANGK